MNGFTLIELLVAMAIASILSAIAIPQYRDYKARAFDIKAQLEIRNIVSAEEVHFLDTEEYLACSNSECEELPGIARVSDDVSIDVSVDNDSYVVEGSHTKGSGKVFVWNSEQGGFLEGS